MDTKKRENLVVYFKLLLLMHYDTEISPQADPIEALVLTTNKY